MTWPCLALIKERYMKIKIDKGMIILDTQCCQCPSFIAITLKGTQLQMSFSKPIKLLYFSALYFIGRTPTVLGQTQRRNDKSACTQCDICTYIRLLTTGNGAAVHLCSCANNGHASPQKTLSSVARGGGREGDRKAVTLRRALAGRQ